MEIADDPLSDRLTLVTIIPTDLVFSYKFAFILFLSFITNEKQESGFLQVGGLVTRNISAFCL